MSSSHTAPESTTRTITDAGDAGTPPPAYFLSLKIANFRCFGPEQTLDLSDGNGRPAHWTILLGENRVGKTSLLRACYKALQVYNQDERLERVSGAKRQLPR